MDNNNTVIEQENNNGAQSVNSANNQQSNDGNNGIDYDKIQNMINKGVSQKENAILKSYFSQQGMTEEEIKSAINDWKAKKQSSAQEQKDNFEKLQASQKELQEKLNKESTMRVYDYLCALLKEMK